ncbi:MAG: hypothetical protein VXZ35_12105, partial [Pseudomonadota bacterium]|nr:hypothetical protein [Pseudomonadota bacterium]
KKNTTSTTLKGCYRQEFERTAELSLSLFQITLHAPSIKRGINTHCPFIYMCAGEKKVPKISVCCVIHLTPEIGNKLVGRGLYRTKNFEDFYSQAQFSSTTIL